MFEQIVTHFNEQIDIASMNTESLTPYIAEAATLLASKLGQGCIYIVCSDQAFSAGFELNRLLLGLNNDMRPSFPSIFLNNNQAGLGKVGDDCFAKVLPYLAKQEDVMVIYATSGKEKSLQQAAEEAINSGLSCLYIGPNSQLSQYIQKTGSVINLPELKPNQSLQLQVSLTHLLIDLSEIALFGRSISNE